MGQHGAVQCRRCGAAIRLVSESGLTSGIDVGWPAAFAGKPAPTGFGVSHPLAVNGQPSAVCGIYLRASRIRLNGVSVARLNVLKPASVKTLRNRASPAWAPRPSPTSWDSEFGVQMKVEAA